jgi:lipopolysaccharide/colanic/teichoic acid biosynthesis glycosyltransferase
MTSGKRGRNIAFEGMLKLDQLCVIYWSLWIDIRPMRLTLPAVLRRGAN